jgi:dynein heavy chain
MTKAAGSLETTPAGIKLWVHEVLRVFFDRLVDDPDRLWLGRLLTELTEKHFKERLTGLLGLTASTGAAAAAVGTTGGVADEELLTGLRGLMFGDFMVPGADVKVYRWDGGTLCPAAGFPCMQLQN